MARSRHSVAWRQTLQTEQSHRQQRAPKHPQRSQWWAMLRRGCRLLGSQPHRDEHSDQMNSLHPLTVASKQSSGWQKRQAKRIAAQRSWKKESEVRDSMKFNSMKQHSRTPGGETQYFYILTVTVWLSFEIFLPPADWCGWLSHFIEGLYRRWQLSVWLIFFHRDWTADWYRSGHTTFLVIMQVGFNRNSRVWQKWTNNIYSWKLLLGEMAIYTVYVHRLSYLLFYSNW